MINEVLIFGLREQKHLTVGGHIVNAKTKLSFKHNLKKEIFMVELQKEIHYEGTLIFFRRFRNRDIDAIQFTVNSKSRQMVSFASNNEWQAMAGSTWHPE